MNDITDIMGGINAHEIATLTSDLVKIPSHKNIPTREERVNEYITKWLEANNFDITTHNVDGVPVPLARIKGKSRDNGLLLNGHSDTTIVDYMEDPFSGVIDERFVYGRGSADMKGGLAAMMIALRTVQRYIEPATDLYFFPSTQEETGECSTSRQLRCILPTKYCVVGEPTNLEAYIAGKGLYFLRIVSYGKSAHLSVPDQGVNAIDNLREALSMLDKTYIKERATATDGQSLFVLCSMQGGTEGIPDYAEALYNRRTVPGDSIQKDTQMISALLQDLSRDKPGFDVRVETYKGYEVELPSMAPATDGDFLNACRLTFGDQLVEDKFYPAWTEGAIFRQFGMEVVIFGPGRLENAHTPDDKVEITQLQRACEGYLKFIMAHHTRFKNGK